MAETARALGLGSTLASLRGDRVIAVDANPDRGTLCDKLRLETAATVRDLLNEEDQIRRYADVRAYTTQVGLDGECAFCGRAGAAARQLFCDWFLIRCLQNSSQRMS